MAALVAQNIVDAGTDPTFSAANLTDTAPIGNGLNTFIAFKNSDTNSKTITITSHAVLDNGDTGPNHVVTLAANTGSVKIPLRKSYDDGTGYATVTVSGTGGVTGVTSAVMRLG